MNKTEKVFEVIENNQLIAVIRNGFIGAIPFLLVGAFSLVIISFPIEGYQGFISSVLGGSIYNLFNAIYRYTLGSLSLILLISLSYYYGKYFGKRERHVFPIVSVMSYLVFIGISGETLDITVFDQSWTLTAVIIALTSAALYNSILEKIYQRKKDVYYHYSTMNKFIYLMVPTAVVLLVFAGISTLLTQVFGSVIAQNFFSQITEQIFQGLGVNYGSAMLFMFLCQFMWMFGIHGSNVLHSVSSDLFEQGVDINQLMISMGKEPTHILSKTFIDVFVNIGGCGTALCILIALLITTNDKSGKRLARYSSIPILFNISETLVFGIPVIFNPIMFIPFIIVPLVSLSIAYGATALGIVPMVVNPVNWTTPILMSGYISTGSLMGSLLQLIIVAVGIAIYLPFIKRLNHPPVNYLKNNLDELLEYIKQMENIGVIPRVLSGSLTRNKVARHLLQDIYKAIENDDLKLFYQPQVDASGKVIGAEGLLRWKHPVCGYLYPPLILYLAQEDGFLDRIEYIVIRKACQDIQDMNLYGMKDLKISINISALQLENEEFYQYVDNIIKEYDFGSCHLAFEITERIALSGSDFVREGIKSLEAHGIEIIMDDFGMGNSSMTYLQNANFSYVKIDGELVKQMLNNERSRSIIATICQLANKLNFRIIAEYVETVEQRDKLHELGCDIYQGYLYEKAIEYDEFVQWTENRNKK